MIRWLRNIFLTPLNVEQVVIPIGIMLFILLGVGFALSKGEWASWVQAVGSIIAIAVSLRVAKDQFENADIRHAQDAKEREAEKERSFEKARQETQRIALQLMVRADLTIKEMLVAYRNPLDFNLRNATVNGLSNMESVLFGLKTLDFKHFPTYDIFEQCIQAMSDITALREHMGNWLSQTIFIANDETAIYHSERLSKCVEEFRRLTGLEPLQRTHRIGVIGIACPTVKGEDLTIHASHTTKS